MARAASSIAAGATWVPVPRVTGRLRAAQLGLVINTADPYSVEVGEHYARRRRIDPSRVLRIELPRKPELGVHEFEALKRAVDEHFGPDVQALALAWTQPYAVECNSITGALALGFDAELCKNGCAASRPSSYANSASVQPFTDHRMRPSMLLAAASVESAKALIDRGVASDRSLGLRGSPPARALFLSTDDKARNVRSRMFPLPGPLRGRGVDLLVGPPQAFAQPTRVVLLQTGSMKLPPIEPIGWLPGALADHLTSFGGKIGRPHPQSTVIDWIESGATASYGTVSEPCSHPQKFPHPQWLLLHYLQGATAIEAYWKSVAWPQQGLFVGEPLAAPFARGQ